MAGVDGEEGSIGLKGYLGWEVELFGVEGGGMAGMKATGVRLMMVDWLSVVFTEDCGAVDAAVLSEG